MARKDLSQVDATDYERSALDYILAAEKRARDTTKYVSVDEAMRQDSVYEYTSDRNVTRVLFISQDESLLNPAKQSLDGFINLSDLFDEVHILILRQGIESKNPILRIAKNLWLYTATHKDWWGTAGRGFTLIEDQMVFADGFRADIIVARDPFESAYVAKKLGQKYNRPVQVHILEDYTKSDFLKKNRHNKWRRYLPRFFLKGIKSVRTSTRAISELIEKRFTINDVAVLPRFRNYAAIIKAEQTVDLREKYKQFTFILLYIGKLNHESALHKVIDGARFGLTNPRIGLVVIGNGPAKKEFEERAKILGVKEQVVFETGEIDEVAYMKSANVLLVPEITPDSDDVALRGAAAGIPLILAKSDTRVDVFKDGEQALIFEEGNIDDISLKLNILMNDVALRREMASRAQDIMRIKFHEDPKIYKRAYRKTIEEVLFLSEVNDEDTTSAT
jgi:glycosyltransferase involved in cell wall biosynthesis